MIELHTTSVFQLNKMLAKIFVVKKTKQTN